MTRSRIKPLGVNLHRELPVSKSKEGLATELPKSGVVPTRISVDLLYRIDDWIQSIGKNQRYRSQWVRDAVINFYHHTVNQSPLELVGIINLFCPIDEVPGPKTMLRTTYRCSGSHKAVSESSKEFLKALAAIEKVLSEAPVSKANPKKTRTDIIVAASRYYLRESKT